MIDDQPDPHNPSTEESVANIGRRAGKKALSPDALIYKLSTSSSAHEQNLAEKIYSERPSNQ